MSYPIQKQEYYNYKGGNNGPGFSFLSDYVNRMDKFPKLYLRSVDPGLRFISLLIY